MPKLLSEPVLSGAFVKYTHIVPSKVLADWFIKPFTILHNTSQVSQLLKSKNVQKLFCHVQNFVNHFLMT